MFSILFRLYPLHFSVRQQLLSSLFFGVFVALFLIIFQPFGTGGHDFQYKTWFLAGYGVITTFVSLILAFLFKAYFVEENWTLIRQMFWLLLTVFLNAVLCYVYFITFFQYGFSWNNLILFIGYVMLIGVLPITIFTLLNYIYHLRKNLLITTNINQQITIQSNYNNKTNDDSILLVEENQKDELVLILEELLFIKASNNYVELFLQKKETVDRILFRGNLKYVEKQINNPSIIRCHRSYIVNLKKVSETSGNAQGYQLHFNKCIDVVPVSRSKGKLIIEKFGCM